MKRISMLSAGVLAALAIAVILSSATAYASTTTYLCKSTNATNSCPGEDHYGNGTELEAHLVSGTKAVLRAVGELPKQSCSEGTLESTVTDAGGSPADVESENSTFGFSECNYTWETLTPGELSVTATSSGSGLVTFKGFEWRVKAAGLNCIFGGELQSELKGGAPAIIKVNGSVSPVSGQLPWCPTTKAEMEFQIATPTSLYAATSLASTYLCGELSVEDSCASEDRYGTETEIQAETAQGTTVTIEAPNDEKLETCNDGTFGSTIFNAGGSDSSVEGENSTFEFSECNHKWETLDPGRSLFTATSSGSGLVTFHNVELLYEGFGTKCRYRENSQGTVVGGDPAQIDVSTPIELIEGPLCYTYLNVRFELVVSDPAPLYVTH